MLMFFGIYHYYWNQLLKKVLKIAEPINYSSKSEEPVKITLLPYYGGAKGQTLQILETPNGVVTNIIKTPPELTSTTTETVTDLENPPLPSKTESDYYKSNIDNIHQTASNIIKLQEKAKEGGDLSETDKQNYEENLDSLNLSAQNLAKIQEEGDTYDYNSGTLTAWFERKKNNKLNKQEGGNKKKGEKEEEEEEENTEDGVAINLPPDDASVAEAKPVGLAVAGVGGVAASKPIATAVVGPGGLAIARPVGTAIAGVAPDQALVPIYAEGYVGVKPTSNRKKNETSNAENYLNKIISKYHIH